MRGKIIFNGNMGSLPTLMERVRPWIGGKVLMVTAAWGQGEFHEEPVRAALNGAGISSRWVGGFDQNIQNLCLWHTWKSWLSRHPQTAQRSQELEQIEDLTRAFYLEKTSFLSNRIRRAVKIARNYLPNFRLADIPLLPRDTLKPESLFNNKELLQWTLTRELGAELTDLTEHDARMLEAFRQAERSVADRTGLLFDPDYQSERERLVEKILEADTLFFFGGEPWELLAPLKFFELKPALMETLRRGATLVCISAGSLSLCERVIVYNDFASDPEKREFRLFHQGLGIVGGLQLLPHCMDRIHTDDSDNLAYLARRFSSHHCAGLNEESFLLVELGNNTATSIGSKDGVYLFGMDGIKRRYNQGEQIAL
jgi:peptidase E